MKNEKKAFNEDFVTFEIAKKLKEKGFREKVNAYYGRRENIFDVHPALDMNDADYRCSAPTISQVLKWLREEKGLHIAIGYSNVSKWRYIIIHLGENFVKESNVWEKSFKSYEEAVLAGIEYVLDNLI